MISTRNLLASTALVLATGPAFADVDWPTESVMLVTHSSAGGGGDVMLRNLAPTLEGAFGISTTVDNRVGGSGAVAATWLVNQANPDGYTLKSVTPTQLITPLRSDGIPTFEEMTPIARLFLDPTTLYVHEESPLETIDDFLDYARENPRDLSIGIGSAGSLDQLVLQNFAEATDIEVRTVPHEGGGDAVVALLGQHVDAVIGEPGQALTHLQDGTLRMLTVFQEERLDSYPDVPTMVETGYDVVSNKFRGIFGPPGMDPEMASAIASRLSELYDEEPWNTYWTEASLSAEFMDPEEFTEYLGSVNEEMREFIEGLN